MNNLGLHDSGPASNVFTGGFSIDNLTWWFWVKAGIGFSLGAGGTYVAFQIVWAILVAKMPMLQIARWLTRF